MFAISKCLTRIQIYSDVSMCQFNLFQMYRLKF